MTQMISGFSFDGHQIGKPRFAKIRSVAIEKRAWEFNSGLAHGHLAKALWPPGKGLVTPLAKALWHPWRPRAPGWDRPCYIVIMINLSLTDVCGSVHGFVEPSRPRTGGSSCDRIIDPVGSLQWVASLKLFIYLILNHKLSTDPTLDLSSTSVLITDLYMNNLDTGLASLSIANGDPFKLTSPAQHALRG